MQPGFSIILETDCPDSLIHDKICQWAGSWLNFEQFDDGKKYSIISDNGVNGVSQKTVIYSKKINSSNTNSGLDKGHVLLVESALLTVEDDDPEAPEYGIPSYSNLRPSSLFAELLKDGKWFRNGLHIINKAKTIGFDAVDETWKTIEDSSERLPQVIIGWGGRGNLPSVNPEVISTILCGFADVYVPASGAAMESINSKMGKFGVPSGAVRVFTSNPNVISRQPLYTDERIRTRPNGRQFELDIFLRLAKLTLRGNMLQIITELESEGLGDNLELSVGTEPEIDKSEVERLKNLNNEIIKMNNMLQDESDRLRTENEDAYSENESLLQDIGNHKLMLEDHKGKIESDKQKIKQLLSNLKSLEDITPYIRQIIVEEELNDVEEVINYLQNLREEDFVEEIELGYGEYDSISSVLQHINTNNSDSFIICQSAFKSAKKHKTFRYPRRIMEAFEMMELSLPSLRSIAGKNKRIDYKRIFRRKGDFDVANKESKATMDQYGDFRKFKHGNETITMGAHIKIGTGADDECSRIHLKLDKQTNKIWIGHCGLHLPTASGR